MNKNTLTGHSKFKGAFQNVWSKVLWENYDTRLDARPLFNIP